MFEEHQGDNPFALSIGDLMAGVLFIFILLLAGSILKVEEELDPLREQREAKRHVIEKLTGELEEFDVEVDPTNGVIRIKEGVLFAYDRSDLSNEGENFLDRFIPKYSRILLSDSLAREQLAQIIIEGHTDRNGNYLYNMNLSLNRANSVVQYVYAPTFDTFAYKDRFRNLLSVNGRSFEQLRDSTNSAANRRVEFKFRFKDLELVNETIDSLDD